MKRLITLLLVVLSVVTVPSYGQGFLGKKTAVRIKTDLQPRFNKLYRQTPDGSIRVFVPMFRCIPSVEISRALGRRVSMGVYSAWENYMLTTATGVVSTENEIGTMVNDIRANSWHMGVDLRLFLKANMAPAESNLHFRLGYVSTHVKDEILFSSRPRNPGNQNPTSVEDTEWHDLMYSERGKYTVEDLNSLPTTATLNPLLFYEIEWVRNIHLTKALAMEFGFGINGYFNIKSSEHSRGNAIMGRYRVYRYDINEDFWPITSAGIQPTDFEEMYEQLHQSMLGNITGVLKVSAGLVYSF